MGKNMVKNKNKNKKYIQQRKNSLAKGRTYSICTEGRRLLDHCATLTRIKYGGILLFKVLFSWNSANGRCLKLVELYLSRIQRQIWGKLVIIIFLLLLLTFRPPFPKRFFCLSHPNGMFIARHLRHLFVAGIVKNTLTTVFTISRITFTVDKLSLDKKVLLKVLPQIQSRRQ